MADLRSTAEFIEVAAGGSPALRSTCSFVEVLGQAVIVVTTALRATQGFIEIASSGTPEARCTRGFLEVLAPAGRGGFGHINNPISF